MTDPDTWPKAQRCHGKLPSLTTDELAAINDRLRTAYRSVEEVEAIIKGRVPRPMMDKYLKTRWGLRMLGENLNNRIDWLNPPQTEQQGGGNG
jgi:hypothetical protein